MFFGIVCQPLITFPLPKTVTAVTVPHLSLDKITLGAGRFSAVHQMCWHSPSPKAMILCTAERTSPVLTLSASSLTVRASTAILLTLFFVLFNFVLIKKKEQWLSLYSFLYLNIMICFIWTEICDTFGTIFLLELHPCDPSMWTSPVMVWKCLVDRLVSNYAHVFVYVIPGACEGQRYWIPLKLKLYAVGSHSSWDRATEFRSSARTVYLLNHRAELSLHPQFESLYAPDLSSVFEDHSLSGEWMRLVIAWVEERACGMRRYSLCHMLALSCPVRALAYSGNVFRSTVQLILFGNQYWIDGRVINKLIQKDSTVLYRCLGGFCLWSSKERKKNKADF